METSNTLFVYDGWNLIQELDGNDPAHAVQKSYVWGLDLSQSIQGAGGVGGLLAMTENGNTYLYCHDANGNVGRMINASDGSVAAAYEYAPFGALVHQSGDMADANPFRFSTKYFDKEVGLIHYDFRDYEPGMGRWLSRDPIEEEGGFNLYAFLNNDSVNAFDALGLWKATPESSGAARRVYMWEEGDTKESLAKKVKLNISEFEQWAIPLTSILASPDDGVDCQYSVPNIWVAADLLQGGGIYDRVVNIGGSVGRFIGTDLFTWGFQIIKPNDIPDLRGVIQSNKNDLWGMVVFGHGDPSGDLLIQSNYRTIINKSGIKILDRGDYGIRWIHQSVLRNDVRLTDYKLAKIYMMQCYSAAGNHRAEWKKLTEDFFGYKGVNAFGVDLYYLNPLNLFK